MTTERAFTKILHPSSTEDKHKKILDLQEFFKYVVEGKLNEMIQIIEDKDFAEKSLNIGLGKAFGVYKPSNMTSKEIITTLLRNNADPNTNIDLHTRASSYNKNGATFFTGLMNAAAENDIQLANILIEYKCRVDLKDNFLRNALFYAINTKNGDPSAMISLLISNGIELNEVDIEGHTALTLAITKGMKHIAIILLENGADINYRNSKDGNTPLHYAAMINNVDILYALLSRKPILCIRNKNEQTPMEVAATCAKTEIYQILAEEYNRREAKIENKSKINDKIIPGDDLEDEVDHDEFTSNAQNNTPYVNINQAKLNPQFSKPNSNFTQSDNNKHFSSNYNNINNINSSLQNIQININNLSHSEIQKNTQGANGFSKSAKLQKLLYLQEKRNQEKGGRSAKDKVYKFPQNQNQNNSGNCSNIEIPFSFQNNIDRTTKPNTGNQLHTYIKIQSTPVLHIDISDETKQDQFILNSQLEDLKVTNNNQASKIIQIENNINSFVDENTSLKIEVNRMKEELKNKEKVINGLTIEFSTKENEFMNQLDEMRQKFDEKSLTLQCVLDKYEKTEKELFEIKSKEFFPSACNECKANRTDLEISKIEYLEKKFSLVKYDEKYIIKNLQRDILDFQEHTKEQIKKVKSTQEELIKLILEAVNECMPDYEVRLYGSHATNLCLQWSDLDVVLIHKKNFNATNYQVLHNLYLNLHEKGWKKSIKLIDSAVVPIIKMTSTEKYNSMHIDISLQDGKHYGLKCVELVKSFMRDYEALEPLIFALKNILKNANLNDPYTGGLSSYGLILMVVSFLQNQLENKKSIKIADGNIGRLFLEFLWHYGIFFDHTKYVIYAYPPNEAMSDKESINFLYNMQAAHELIIVDPLSKNNNVARSTYQFVSIKMAFMIGFIVSQEECECGCHYNRLGEESLVHKNDHCILKRIFNSVKRFNANSTMP